MSKGRTFTSTKLRRLLAAMIAAALGTSAPAFAEDGAAPAGPNTGKLSFSGGIDFTTHYFFRGIWQEDQGLIAQPYGGMGVALYEGDGWLNSITLNVGVWASLHDGPTGTGDDVSRPEGLSGDPQIFYEFDVSGGISLGLFDDWTVGLTWTAYTSPNDRFNTIQDVAVGLGYNDSDFWNEIWPDSGFALNPSVTLIFETDDQADAGNSLFGPLTNTDEGVYLGIGIKPAFTIIQSETNPVTLTIPVTVGLSLDDYYEQDTDGDGSAEDETFGYVDLGVELSTPLSFMPSDYGSWSFKIGAHFMWLSENNAFANQPGAGDTGDEFEIIGITGISFSY